MKTQLKLSDMQLEHIAVCEKRVQYWSVCAMGLRMTARAPPTHTSAGSIVCWRGSRKFGQVLISREMKAEDRIAIDTRRARLTNSIKAIRAAEGAAHNANNPAAMVVLQLALWHAQAALLCLDLAEKALQ